MNMPTRKEFRKIEGLVATFHDGASAESERKSCNILIMKQVAKLMEEIGLDKYIPKNMHLKRYIKDLFTNNFVEFKNNCNHAYDIENMVKFLKHYGVQFKQEKSEYFTVFYI